METKILTGGSSPAALKVKEGSVIASMRGTDGFPSAEYYRWLIRIPEGYRLELWDEDWIDYVDDEGNVIYERREFEREESVVSKNNKWFYKFKNSDGDEIEEEITAEEAEKLLPKVGYGY